MKKHLGKTLQYGALSALLLTPLSALHASSHMDAPLITYDDPANTTDVYAFKTSRSGQEYLEVALAVYPFEVPGVGPNKYNFDPDVVYSIHVGLGNDVAAGETTKRYDFRFTTSYKNQQTILQSYLGVIQNVDDDVQNLTQTYTVTLSDSGNNNNDDNNDNDGKDKDKDKKGKKKKKDKKGGNNDVVLGSGVVPPNNQGFATPFYNQGDNGENPEKEGVDTAAELDRYTSQTITTLVNGYRAWAGQREDGFYGDIQAIFDLLQLRSGGVNGSNSFDSQSGFNVHTIVLEIPVSELGGDQQVVAVHATTSRPKVTVLKDGPTKSEPKSGGGVIQVGRQGNPLFNEALVAIADKDLYSRTSPVNDAELFRKYALTPELATLIDVLVFGDPAGGEDEGGIPDDRLTDRTDIAGIFIPDTIKVDLSTDDARLTGATEDSGFSRLGIFGGDVLTSSVQTGFFGNGTVPGGWPNGRRFGDDVIDIAVFALANDLRDPANPIIDIDADGIDNVSANDSLYNKVFPYASTPHNGRNYEANVLYNNPGLPAQP